MEGVFRDFHEAYAQGSGPLLSTTLTPAAPLHDPQRLQRFAQSSNNVSIVQDVRGKLLHNEHGDAIHFSKGTGNAWVDVYVAFWKAAATIPPSESNGGHEWTTTYRAWKDLSDKLIKGFSGGWFEAWTVPCLYVVARYLRIFAIKADNQPKGTDELKFDPNGQEDDGVGLDNNAYLEDTARVINRIFTLCISDRSPLEESRRWGLYYTTNLLFKTYFKLNSVSLSKNILRAIQASKVDIPPMDAFPKAHIVTYKYYVGVIFFLEESYEKAEENLADALKLCHRGAQRNRELILTYLIPCRLLTTHSLPTADLLAPFPRLGGLFGELCRCIKRGDLAGFDVALAAGEVEFVKRRIYLTLERGRDIALRNLLRKVYIAGGFEEPSGGAPAIRRSRVPVSEFAAAIRIGTNTKASRLDVDEVECLLSNMIYKNLMKGYISHERGIAVLSKGVAFPGTGV